MSQQNLVEENNSIIKSKLRTALLKRLKNLGVAHDEDPNPHIFISENGQYCLIEEYFCRLEGDLSITRLVKIEDLHGPLPPVKWILPYTTDRVLLAGSQPLDIEEVAALNSGSELALGHETDLFPKRPSNTETLSSFTTCSCCLQARPSDICWKCNDCKEVGSTAEGNMTLCIRCLQNGRWCKPDHRLVSQKHEKKSIGWRATHAVRIVNFREEESEFETYVGRYSAQSTGKPIVHESLGTLTWKLKDSHFLNLQIRTDASVEGNRGIQPKTLPGHGQNITDTNAMETENSPGATKDEGFSMSSCISKTVTPAKEEIPSLISSGDSFCDVCLATIGNSQLLSDSTLWSQRSLEELVQKFHTTPGPITETSKGKTTDVEREGGIGGSKSSRKWPKNLEILDIETLQHHLSLQSLAHSIINGCLLCCRLWKSMGDAEKEEVRDQVRQLVLARPHPSNNVGTVPGEAGHSKGTVVDVQRLSSNLGALLLRKEDTELGWSVGDTRLLTLVDCLFGRVSESMEESKMMLDRGISEQGRGVSKTTTNTGSEETLSIARKWLRDCKGSHDCGCQKETDWIPTRLIDVGTADGLRPIRLYITTEDDKGTEYMTLSHRWGNSNTFQLTRSNYNQMVKGVPAFNVPITFLHAIEICRRLGGQYLWIDAACIVQDDNEDWEKESKLMAAVYKNSTCTIAALFSDSVYSGCFSVRNSAGHMPILFQNYDGAVFAMPSEGGEGIHLTDDHNLNNRGWVFQERLLSPRTLGFSSTGIIWDCKEAQYQEMSPTEDEAKTKPSNYTRDKEMMEQLTTRPFHSNTKEADRRYFLMAWYELVNDYSGLCLTYQKDKLIALSGVTQIVQQWSNFDYFYGLWIDPESPEFFLRQLLWHTYEPEEHIGLQRPAERPPSFSWTSCNCAVDYPVTFHDRITNDSNIGLTKVKKSSRMLAGDVGIQVLQRHKSALMYLVRGNGRPGERDVEFRTKVIKFVSTNSGAPKPYLLLEGPVKEVTIQRTAKEKGKEDLLWEYPWDALPGDEKDNTLRTRWFFPDASEFPSPMSHVTLLTIARWYDSWERRWYVAGLALLNTKNNVWSSAGDKEIRIPASCRVGYFEHSWKTRREHWFCNGHIQMVAII